MKARSVLECGRPLPLLARGTSHHDSSENPNGIPARSPGLRGASYPGKGFYKNEQPQRGCGVPGLGDATTPLGLWPIISSTQGSSCLATQGWRTQSLWDWSAALLVALLLSGICAHAQNFSIDWFTIDGGGGTSTGGLYSVIGTIGQPDANAQPPTCPTATAKSRGCPHACQRSSISSFGHQIINSL
jgi:hypothetical protein